MIYFDNNSSTQLAPPVLDAMRSALETTFGNPASAHSAGRDGQKVVREARESLAELLGAAEAEEMIFTSGGTESDNWAITAALEARPERDHIVTTAVEHEAVRKTCERLESRGASVTWIGVDEEGSLDLDALKKALTQRTAVVSAMMSNNETGVRFPIDEIGRIVKDNSDALFHVDAVNAVGKVPIDLKTSAIDLLSLSAHKFYGPKGIGALYVRKGVDLPPMLMGGGQEMGMRPGTPAVHQLAGLGAAARFVRGGSSTDTVREMRDRLENGILASIPNAYVNGTRDAARRLPNTTSVSFENTNGEMIMSRLDEAGICVSTGSACHTQDHRASAVLQAMNVPYSRAMGAIRFSLGKFNTPAEVDETLKVLPGILNELRMIGGNYETKTV